MLDGIKLKLWLSNITSLMQDPYTWSLRVFEVDAQRSANAKPRKCRRIEVQGSGLLLILYKPSATVFIIEVGTENVTDCFNCEHQFPLAKDMNEFSQFVNDALIQVYQSYLRISKSKSMVFL